MNKFLGFASALAITALLAAAPVSAADLVVATAKGVDLQPGAKVDGTKILKLDAGQKLTLISNDGKTIKLTGPYEGAPAPETVASGGIADSLKGLVAAQGAGTANLGVTRGAETHALPEAWLIDVTTGAKDGGDRCILADAPQMVLWNPTPVATPGGVLRPADKSFQAKLNWPAQADRLAVPLKKLVIKDGATYQVELQGTTSSLVFHTIPATASTDAVKAAWMVEKGCNAQAAALVKTLQ
jgi:hypothetical protein